MRTNTNQYRASHQKEPRGYGKWGFDMIGTDDNGSYTSEVVWATGNFGEAKKQAVREFKSMSRRIKTVTEVVVLP